MMFFEQIQIRNHCDYISAVVLWPLRIKIAIRGHNAEMMQVMNYT